MEKWRHQFLNLDLRFSMSQRLGATSKNLDDGDIFTLPFSFSRCDACGLLILLHSHRCFSVWSDQNDGLVFYEALKPPPQ